jgi:hypothetical protein
MQFESKQEQAVEDDNNVLRSWSITSVAGLIFSYGGNNRQQDWYERNIRVRNKLPSKRACGGCTAAQEFRMPCCRLRVPETATDDTHVRYHHRRNSEYDQVFHIVTSRFRLLMKS